MLNLRSRAAVAGVTAGAVVLLALPVVAAGQVPAADGVIGGVGDTVSGVTSAPPVVAPVPVPAPPAPADQSREASPAPAPAAAPAASAPSGQRRAAPSTGGATVAAASSSSSSRASGGAGSSSGRAEANAAAAGDRERPSASQADRAPTDAKIASAADAPEDANPSTLPFTGFGLALIAALGLAAVAGGGALRRGLRGGAAG
jgi:hypothetical protein